MASLKTEFNNNFNKAHKVYEITKSTASELRGIYEEKLAQQEEEHEIEVRQILESNKKEVDDLRNKLATAQVDTDMYKRNNKIVNDERDRIAKSEQDNLNELVKLQDKLKEDSAQIESLRGEIRGYEEQLRKKEKKIHEFKYKVSDLQKTKHIISYRAMELQKSIEPKEGQIEQLMDDLFKLEGEFENQVKSSYT